jgi:hypothetical protein
MITLSDTTQFYDAKSHGCEASFPVHSFAPPPHSFNMQGHRIVSEEPVSECGGVAVLVSGTLGQRTENFNGQRTENLATSLQHIEDGIVKPLLNQGRKVDVFYHIGMQGSNVVVPSSLPQWLKG